MNIVCSGPGPHQPATGVLGSSDVSVTGMRCPAPACAPAPDPLAVNNDTLRTRANAALTTNATYLALSAGALTPTALQQTVQVNKLTRECNILIRLVLSLLDDISGS